MDYDGMNALYLHMQTTDKYVKACTLTGASADAIRTVIEAIIDAGIVKDFSDALDIIIAGYENG